MKLSGAWSVSTDAATRLAQLNGGGLQPDGLVLLARDADKVIGEANLPAGDRIEFEASGIRRERTGIHARIEISCAGRVAAYSILNIERDEDRTRLANSAGRRISGDKVNDAVKVRLDQFCREAWPTWIAGDTSEWSEREEIKPITHLLYPYVMAEAGTIVFGYKGQGKSWLGVLWTMMLQHGISSRWNITRPVNALFVNLERGRDSVDRRRAMVGQMLGVRGMRSFHARGRSLSDIREAVRADIKRHGIEVVIVDSLSRAGTGKLTTDEDTNRAMDILNGFGCSWVALAHTAKHDGEHVYGSLMQENAADVIVQLAGCRSALRETTIGCRLRVTSANDLPPIRPEVYALDFEGGAMAALREADRGEFPDLALEGASPADQVAEVISEEGASSVEALVLATGLSRSTVYETLKLSRFVRLETGGGRGKKASYGLRTVTAFSEPVWAGQDA